MSVQLGSGLRASVLFWPSGSIDTSCIKLGLKEPDRAFDTEPFRATRWRQLLFAGLGFFIWLMMTDVETVREGATNQEGGRV